MKQKFRYKKDIILIAAFLAIGAVLAAVVLLGAEDGGKVQVRVDGNVVATYPLAIDRTVEIDGYEGGRNLLVIEDGYASVTEASCPDGICIRTGKINKKGQSIICLPNRVSVEVITGEDTGVDIVVGGIG